MKKPNALFRCYYGLDDLYSVQTQAYTDADYQATAEEQNRYEVEIEWGELGASLVAEGLSQPNDQTRNLPKVKAEYEAFQAEYAHILRSSGYKAYCEQQWQIEFEQTLDVLLRCSINKLLIDKRKEYPDDDDMTYARREKALIVEAFGEDDYNRWLETDWGKGHTKQWERIIDKLGELGT